MDRLESKGFILRKVSARDRRARELTLTDLGDATLAAARPLVRDMQNDMLSGLDEAERAEFLRLARKAADGGNDLSRAPLAK